MKHIGAVLDENGKEYQIALLKLEQIGNYLFKVLVKPPGSNWAEQKDVLVSNSTEARSWAKKKLENGIFI